MAPVVHLGWVLAADERDHDVLHAYEQAHQRLIAVLQKQFPQFRWVLQAATHRTFVPPQGALDPLPLLELGLQEKTYNGWDYALPCPPSRMGNHALMRQARYARRPPHPEASVAPLVALGDSATRHTA